MNIDQKKYDTAFSMLDEWNEHIESFPEKLIDGWIVPAVCSHLKNLYKLTEKESKSIITDWLNQ